MDETNQNTAPRRNNMMPVIAVVVLLLLGGLVFLAMSGTRQNPTTQNQSQTTVEPTAVGAMTDEKDTMGDTAITGAMEEVTGAVEESTSQVKTFTVSGKNFSFAPSEIRVKKGDKVKIIFQNTGGMHDWVIDELNVKTNVIQGGQSETVEFTADKAGTYEYYCSVGNHRQMGMVGKLIVE